MVWKSFGPVLIFAASLTFSIQNQKSKSKSSIHLSPEEAKSRICSLSLKFSFQFCRTFELNTNQKMLFNPKRPSVSFSCWSV